MVCALGGGEGGWMWGRWGGGAGFGPWVLAQAARWAGGLVSDCEHSADGLVTKHMGPERKVCVYVCVCVYSMQPVHTKAAK